MTDAAPPRRYARITGTRRKQMAAGLRFPVESFCSSGERSNS